MSALTWLTCAATLADNYWMSPTGGAFTSGSNWSTGTMPGPTDTAAFGLAATYQVWAAQPMFVGSMRSISGDVSLVLTGGELNLLNPGMSVFEHSLNVGSEKGVAALRVLGGPLRAVSSYLSTNWDDEALVEVVGAGSAWTNWGEMFVGFAGGATLRATQGGVVTARSAYLGGSFTGWGEAIIADAGSALVVDSRLVVGSAGLASLAVENGAVVAAPFVDIGAMSGGQGSVTAVGVSSELHATHRLTVGGSAFGPKGGYGSVIADAGGRISAGEIVIAQNEDAVGEVTLQGAGTMATANLILVGPKPAPPASPSARLRIGSGASVEVETLEVSPHGRLEGAGAVGGLLVSRGVVSPGEDAPGLLSVLGDYEQVGAPVYYLATSVLDIRLGGPPGSSNVGRLLVAGEASLAGRLRVSIEDGFEPEVGQIYEVLSAQSINGAFQHVVLPKKVGVWRARYSANATSVFIEIMPGGIPGDTNGDCMVNFADLNNVLSFYGQTGFGLIGDVNGDGLVNFHDLNLVLSYFGQSCSPSPPRP